MPCAPLRPHSRSMGQTQISNSNMCLWSLSYPSQLEGALRAKAREVEKAERAAEVARAAQGLVELQKAEVCGSKTAS